VNTDLEAIFALNYAQKVLLAYPLAEFFLENRLFNMFYFYFATVNKYFKCKI